MESAESRKLTNPWIVALVTVALVGVGLIVSGIALWCTANKTSTAESDLGLTLLGGGIALLSGVGVAIAVFSAERGFDTTLRRREEAAAKQNLLMSLSMTQDLTGVDLRGRDLRDIVLRDKRLDSADLSGADLRLASLSNCSMEDTMLKDADLRDAYLGTALAVRSIAAIGADFTGADLRGATVIGDVRRALFDRADLRGADLTNALAIHPHQTRPDVTDEETQNEAAVFINARYDGTTRWPDGVTPRAVGAVRVPDS
jgi:hypothetical protein